MSMTYRLPCDCGKVMLIARGAPAARAICHCHACRELYGSIVLAATAWPVEQVERIGDEHVLEYQHPTLHMRRASCRHCGETIHGINRLGYLVIPNARLIKHHHGAMPEELAPTMHLFYESRVFDIDDSLPKYLQGWDGDRYN